MKEDAASDIDRSNKSESEENEDKKTKTPSRRSRKSRKKTVFSTGNGRQGYFF